MTTLSGNERSIRPALPCCHRCRGRGVAALTATAHGGSVEGVTAVWIRFRAELRSRLTTWLALALAAGIACGLVVALAAASQRTATAYPRFIAATNSADA